MDYSNKDIIKRIVQSITKVSRQNAVTFFSHKLNHSNSSENDFYNFNPVKVNSKTGHVRVSLKFFLKELSAFLYHWLLIFYKVLIHTISFRKLSFSSSLVYGIPEEYLVSDKALEGFLVFTKRGPVKLAFESELLVIQSKNNKIYKSIIYYYS